MDMPENNCPELIEKTADAIDDASLWELFVSTQMNNLDLCARDGVKWVSHQNVNFKMLTISRHVLKLPTTTFDEVFVVVLCKFPHYWVCFTNSLPWVWKDWAQNRLQEK